MWFFLAAALAADPVQTPVQVTLGGGPDLAFVRLGMGSRKGWLTTGGFGGVKVIGFPLGEATMLPLRRSWVEPVETVIAPDVGVYVGLGSEWIGARLGVGYALPAMVDAFAQVARAPEAYGLQIIFAIYSPLLLVAGFEGEAAIDLSAPRSPVVLHAGMSLQIYRALLGEPEDAPSAWTPFVSVEVRIPGLTP